MESTLTHAPEKGESGQDPISIKNTSEIYPSPENSDIYDPFENKKDFQSLVESVRAKGILEPLVLTLDDFILSGHRRHAAAVVAAVPTLGFSNSQTLRH